MPPLSIQHHSLRQRRADEVDYWRAQAGWVDDATDPDAVSSTTTTTNTEQSGAFGDGPDEVVKSVLKVLCVVVALGLSVLFFRAIMRRMSSEKEKKRPEKSRAGSSRRSRSRSRSRKREKGEYDLMKDDDEKSKRSSRSRSSRSRRGLSRSRSRTDRSRSKSRSRVEKPTEPVQEAVLV